MADTVKRVDFLPRTTGGRRRELKYYRPQRSEVPEWPPAPSPETRIEMASTATPWRVANPAVFRRRFEERASRWRRETAHYSVTSRRILHDAFLEILAMGPRVLPYIVEDLRRTRDHWFPALRAFATPFDAGAGASTHDEAVDAWLLWWDDIMNDDVPDR